MTEVEPRPTLFYLLVAHHPPALLNRTVHVRAGRASLYVCARCLGKWFGIIAALSYQLVFPIQDFTLWWLLSASLMPLPATINWSLQIVKERESANHVRFLTGVLWGGSLGLAVGRAMNLEGGSLFVLLGVYLCYVAGVCLLLRFTGKMEAYLRPFEEFVAQRKKAVGDE